jgi:hypothetical protein
MLYFKMGISFPFLHIFKKKIPISDKNKKKMPSNKIVEIFIPMEEWLNNDFSMGCLHE